MPHPLGFNRLCLRLWKRAFRIAKWRLGNAQDASDLAQKMLIILFEKKLLEPGQVLSESEATKLEKMAVGRTFFLLRTEFRSRLRSAEQRSRLASVVAGMEEPLGAEAFCALAEAVSLSLDDEQARDVLAEFLWFSDRLPTVVAAFADLAPEHRAVLLAHYVMGLSRAAAAEYLKIPPGTVESRRRTAVDLLKEAVTRRGEHVAKPLERDQSAAGPMPSKAVPSSNPSPDRGTDDDGTPVTLETVPSSNPPPDRGTDDGMVVGVVAASGADPEDVRS